jgi:pyridoxal phosphate enzyme (YggS family)
MSIQIENYLRIKEELKSFNAELIAVSKTKPASDIQELYDLGQRNFGENYVQELTEKIPQFPSDLNWHFIGHLQSNKVKQIADLVHLIHGVDSIKLAKEISKFGLSKNKKINCLLQIFIADEETKFGLDRDEANELFKEYANGNLAGLQINGLMGMASFSEDKVKVGNEFKSLHNLFLEYRKSDSNIQILSMGMTGDYKIALDNGSNMIRIGSAIFGERNYNNKI